MDEELHLITLKTVELLLCLLPDNLRVYICAGADSGEMTISAVMCSEMVMLSAVLVCVIW